jgi:hypothetical protein
MKFSKSDFDNMSYPVLSIPEDKTVLDRFSGLKIYREFQQDFARDTDKIHKYVILMYTSNILQTLQSLEERKIEAAKLAGFKMSHSRFDDKVEEILACRVPEINSLIIRVCCLERNEDLAELLIYEESYYRELKKLLDGESDKVKETRNNVRQFKEDIKELRKSLLNQDENKDLISKLYDYVEGIQLGISPEEIALAKKSNTIEDLIPNPSV